MIGSIQFQLESGETLEVTEVLFVPRLTKNLLAISTWRTRGTRCASMMEKYLLG